MSMTDDSVTLMIPAKGKVFKIPIANLSDIDRDYITALKNNKVRSKTQNSTQPSTKKTPSKTSTKPAAVKNKTTAKNGRPSQTAAIQTKYRLANNFLTRWPTFTSVPMNVNVRVVKEDKKNQRFIYHSPNYEFICDVPLSKTIVTKFALMFEATRELCKQLPISTMKAHVPGSASRNRILLFASMQNYVKNGGIPSAAGLYRSDTNDVLVPLRSLGVVKRSGSYNYDNNGSNNVLAHELVHQLTDPEYFSPGARGWFSEGLAEYCSLSPYLSGKYMLRNNKNDIKKYASRLGTKVRAPKLKDFMLQSYGSFTTNGAYNYRMGTLITYYFFHMEPDRRNITAFLKALKQGEMGEEAVNVLLNARSFEELEDDIYKAWKMNGIEIMFGSI